MGIKIQFDNTEFSVGDLIKITQKIDEGEKTRTYNFEGVVIAIKGSGRNKSFTVRRIGEAQIGIEKIFPIQSPTIKNIKVIKEGGKGSRRAKLYYIREKSRKQIDKIYSRSGKKGKENKKQTKKTSG